MIAVSSSPESGKIVITIHQPVCIELNAHEGAQLIERLKKGNKFPLKGLKKYTILEECMTFGEKDRKALLAGLKKHFPNL